MLKRIIEESKRVIKKGKKAFLIGLAGLTLLYASGCSITTTREWRSIRNYKETVERGEYKKDNITYKITEPDIINNSVLSVLIIQSGTTETYKEKEIILKEKFEEFTIEKINNKDTGSGVGMGIGAAAGMVGGYSFQSDDINAGYNLAIALFFDGLIGALIGGIIGNSVAGENETKSASTGNIRTEIKNTSTITELINESPIKEAQAETYVLIESENIKFKELLEAKDISPLKSITVYSKDGEAKVRILEDIFEFEFKKEDLIDQIKEWKQIKEIKEPTRSNLLPLIINYIENKEYQIYIKTSDVSTRLKEITNDEKTTSILGYQLSKEKIYLVLEDFINQEINSKIKEARIKLIDESTHTPVKNATLEIETKAPSKQELAKQYFEDSLLEWSTTKIKDYVTGQETLKYDDNGEVVFSVYTTNNYSTESTHPNFAFAKFNFDFSDSKKLKQTITMSQDPQKIKIVDK